MVTAIDSEIGELNIGHHPSVVVVREVTVNLDLTPGQITKLVSGERDVRDRDLATMPSLGTGIKKLVVHFIQVEGEKTTEEIENLLSSLGLVHHPYAQVMVNADDPEFCLAYPNGMYWNRTGRRAANILGFDRRYTDGVHMSGARRRWFTWSNAWWIGGVPKGSM